MSVILLAELDGTITILLSVAFADVVTGGEEEEEGMSLSCSSLVTTAENDAVAPTTEAAVDGVGGSLITVPGLLWGLMIRLSFEGDGADRVLIRL